MVSHLHISAATGAALMESPMRFESPGGEDIVKGVGFTQPVGIVVLVCQITDTGVSVYNDTLGRREKCHSFLM